MQASPKAEPQPVAPGLPALAALEAKASADWLLGAVLALGLALRAWHLFELRRSPFFAVLQLDSEAYDRWARAIAGGALIGDKPFWVDPLYAYVLGGLYRMFGHDVALARVLNMACGVLTAFLVSRIALRVWGSRIAQLSAAFLCVCYVPALHFEGQPEKTALSVLLIALCIDLFTLGSRRGIGVFGAAGVALGLCTLARGNSLVLLPLALCALVLGWDAEPAARGTRSQRMQRAGALACGAVLVISLATVHNWLAARQFVLTTSNLGINLYLGNNAENADGYYTPPSFLHPDSESEVVDFRAEAERRSGAVLNEAELSHYWAEAAWRAVRANPGLAVTRTLHKFALSLHNDELPDNDAVELVGLWSPVLRAPVWWFGQLLPLALLGAIVGFRRRGVRIVSVAVLAYVLSLLPFFVMGRLRIQLLPGCAVLASGAVVWLLGALQARNFAQLARGCGVLLFGAGIALYRPAWMGDHHTKSLAIGWHNLGSSLLERSKIDDAIAAYEHAAGLSATAVPASLRALGQLYQGRGDFERAQVALRRLVRVRPASASARDSLARLYREMLRRGLSSAAIAGMQQTLREAPYDEGLHYLLGETMERESTPQAMIEFFSSEVARDEKPQTSHYFWALGLARQGDLAGAIAHVERALQIDPAHELSQRQWGAWLEQQGQLDAALAHYEEATRIHPEFRAALEDAARVAQQLGRSADAEAFRARAERADPNTSRRFVYWARYLHAMGRDRAAAVELERMLAQAPEDAEALQLRRELGVAASEQPARDSTSEVEPAPAAPSWGLDGAVRAALIARLSDQPEGSSTWIAYDARDAAAQALAREIAATFEAARWRVRSLGPASVTLKPGIVLLAAAAPTAACQTVGIALQATKLPLTVGSDYREFAAERLRADPSYQALRLDDDQDFILVVGRRP